MKISLREFYDIFRTKRLVSAAVFFALRALVRDPEYLLIFLEENGLVGLKKVH